MILQSQKSISDRDFLGVEVAERPVDPRVHVQLGRPTAGVSSGMILPSSFEGSRGPVLAPPWSRQRPVPLIGRFLHRPPVRVFALQQPDIESSSDVSWSAIGASMGFVFVCAIRCFARCRTLLPQ